jgi:hypothetical protein
MFRKAFYFLLTVVIGLSLLGCGGGGGGSSGSDSGTVTVNATDARPVLPTGVEKVLITFDEVSVHKSGGG